VDDSAALASFLLRAKRATYAAQGDDATVTPLLAGSRQLEYREGDLFYRDVYYGLANFAGLETVYAGDAPRWSMAYAGGVLAGTSQAQVRRIYVFLREALNGGTVDAPYRGPAQHASSGYKYVNDWRGALEDFSGDELIRHEGAVVYRSLSVSNPPLALQETSDRGLEGVIEAIR
jgi:hypothetical protein